MAAQQIEQLAHVRIAQFVWACRNHKVVVADYRGHATGSFNLRLFTKFVNIFYSAVPLVSYRV
jgi:hypothetical protein